MQRGRMDAADSSGKVRALATACGRDRSRYIPVFCTAVASLVDALQSRFSITPEATSPPTVLYVG